tara:strand:+ start:146 stop:415 length:270 start_codon:yes stop_codon:yes gene_type:complete
MKYFHINGDGRIDLKVKAKTLDEAIDKVESVEFETMAKDGIEIKGIFDIQTYAEDYENEEDYVEEIAEGSLGEDLAAWQKFLKENKPLT